MPKAVKLADIAEKVGVSIVTVSKALSGQKGVSEEMRARIVALAEELGYRQPSVVRREEARKSYTFGVIIHEGYLDRYASFYWQMYQNISASLMERGSYCLLEVLSAEMEEGLELPKIIRENKVEGVILIGKLEKRYLDFLNAEVSLPRIYVDFTDRTYQSDAVISDSFYGAYLMTNYLFDLGHETIAFVGSPKATGSIMDRYLGYRKSLTEHEVEFKEEWLIEDRQKASGNIDPAKLAIPKPLPSAFFCNSDLTASMVIKRLEQEGLQIPEDVSVVGYDNYIYPGLCDVEITSYEVDMAEMARVAADTILKKTAGEPYRHGVHIVEGHLVVKESATKRP